MSWDAESIAVDIANFAVVVLTHFDKPLGLGAVAEAHRAWEFGMSWAHLFETMPDCSETQS